MVIGAREDDDKGSNSGSAYVYTRDTPGDLASTWTQVAKLTADDGAADDIFGCSVSIDGDTMVIGAHQDDDKGTSSGSAYVFTRDTAGDLGSGWTQVAKLTADDGTGYDRFGYSVSIDGDTVVVGAQTDDDEGDNSGSAFVFTRDTAGDLASGWTQVAKLTAGDGAASDYFGYSVSIDGDTMVVGAYFDDDKATNSGSAYVFTRDTAGDLASGWTQVAKLTADDGADSDKFGYSVSIDGDTMVIGAYQDDDKGLNSGSAYVFTRDTAGNLTSSWTQVAKLTADDGAADDQFGWSVSIDGDTMVIGANHDDNKATNSGSAYVFTRDTPGDLTSNWTQVAKLTAGDGAADDVFGISVSIDGDTMVIGALGDDAVTGSAYVFSIHFPPCDASSPPANGAVGDCTGHLASGSTCQPACDPGYAPTGPTVCDNGVLTPAVCSTYCDASAPPANGEVGNCTEYLLSGTTCQPTCEEYHTVSGVTTCEDGTITRARCDGPCDASAPPANGGAGNCTDKLMRGTECQPTCDEHYTVSGVSKCVGGTLIPAQCLGPCDMDTCCYFYNKRRGFNVPGTCAHLDYMTPSPPPPAPLPISAVGGTISYADGYKIHTFTTTGPNTFTVTSGGTVEYLVVAGGGSGGAASSIAGAGPGAGGGGAGGIITGTLTVDEQPYTITVGAGGAGVAGSTNPANGNNGDDSSISSLVVAKGGGGGGKGTDGVAGLSGGCGGGAGGAGGSGGSGSIGFDGGSSLGENSGGGGGGGMGSVGGDGRTLAGNGGDGIPSSISGTLTYRGAGGAGGRGDSASASAVGGNGGGGDGSSNAASATAGTPNTGSGGGGGKDTSGVKSNGAAGGSGIVIIRYLSAPPAGFRTVNERVLVQDEDGWLLMAAYNHQANTNPNLVSGTTPSSATEGFSHIWPGTHLGLTASDIAEVRFYCHSSNHNRVINFSVNNDWVKTAILTGSISGNSVTYWTSGTTKLDGHTANLPDSATHVWTSVAYNLLAPFYQYGAGHWRLRDPVDSSKWECDDASQTTAHTTLHQIWIKLAE